MITFGQRLRAARKQAKLTQAATAKRVGMSQSALSELENDVYPTSTFTTRLAHLYKVNARWLADGDGPMLIGEIVMPSPQPKSDWPFSDRISPEDYRQLDPASKDDIEDYIEMKLQKLLRSGQKRITKTKSA